MWHDFKSFTIGAGGYVATVKLDALNHYLAAMVAFCTVAALVPLAIERWKKFLGENQLTRTGKVLFFILAVIGILILSALVSGCTVRPKVPGLSFFTGPAKAPEVSASGQVATPGKVTTQRSSTTVPNLPGTVITISTGAGLANSPAAIRANNASPPPVVISSESSHVETPTTYAPPAPPTANEQANADAVRASYKWAILLCLGGGFLIYRHHFKAGGAAIAFGIACPIVTNFISSEWGQRVAIIGACIAVSLFAAWHFLRDKNPTIDEK